MLTNEALDAIERHCTSSAYQFSKAEGRALVGELRAERTRTETLRSALERSDRNFRRYLSGVPVRDVAETFAESEAALAAVDSGGD